VREDERKKRLTEKMGRPVDTPSHFPVFDDQGSQRSRADSGREVASVESEAHPGAGRWVYDVKTRKAQPNRGVAKRIALQRRLCQGLFDETRIAIAVLGILSSLIAIKSADRVLAEGYVDRDAHFVGYIAHRELNHSDRAEFHKFVVQGLLDSITHSGDGKTFETACQVIAVHEEYVLLRLMGLMPSQRSMSTKNGHSHDVMEAVNPKSNEKVTLYLNIDIEEKHLKDALQ